VRSPLVSLRQRLSGQQPDAGFSLVELLVVMAITSGLMGIVFMVLNTVQLQTRDNLGRVDQVQQAKLGLAQIDRQVRSGNVVVDPDQAGELPRSLRVFTQTDGVRKCVQWQVHQDGLRFRSWDPGWNTGLGAVEPWRVVARHVRTDAPAKNFEKVTDNGGSQAQSVLVRLWLQAKEAGGKPVEVTTVLSGRNTVYGYPADVCSPVPPA
jgi:prepilin-type N-terminal cleavage/methylation domain-containing protein